MTIEKCLEELQKATAGRAASDCLYRGESALYPTTYSSHYRLFVKSNRFTSGQADAVKERLVIIAQLLEVIGLGRPLSASADDALKHSPPTTMKDINEVIYSYMQHYHLATPFIDLTADLNIAAAFAADRPPEESDPKLWRGVIYLISKEGLLNSGYRLFDSTDSRAKRPQKQKAVSLFLERDADFQALQPPVVTRFEFEDNGERIQDYLIPDIYDARGDVIAREVAKLAYRCAYEDLASDDPDHGRVVKYFSEIAFRLTDAGAVPAP
jgi:FRG domain